MAESLEAIRKKKVRSSSGKITLEELSELRDNCLELVREGELYDLRNEAKLRAVNNTQSYEEFKNIVDAAHLRSITKEDKANAKTKTCIWNKTARAE